jgi:large subunit ribosomal protein L31
MVPKTARRALSDSGKMTDFFDPAHLAGASRRFHCDPARPTLSTNSFLLVTTAPSGRLSLLAAMKEGIHPKNYRPVIFRDSASGQQFLTRSCAHTALTGEWEDGKEYPLYLMGISSFTHPFYTGQQKFVDTAGRVDKFQQRAARTQALQAEIAAKASKKKKK